MTRQLNNDNGLQAQWTRTPAPNSTYKKLAVQWLNEALFFVSSFVVADSFSASKSPTSCSCQPLPASIKNRHQWNSTKDLRPIQIQIC